MYCICVVILFIKEHLTDLKSTYRPNGLSKILLLPKVVKFHVKSFYEHVLHLGSGLKVSTKKNYSTRISAYSKMFYNNGEIDDKKNCTFTFIIDKR